MFLIEVVALVETPRRLADEEITDMIEAVVDELDARSLEPSVSSARMGDDVEITVEVRSMGPEEFDALALATSAVKAAFEVAAIGSAGMALRRLRSITTSLQPA